MTSRGVQATAKVQLTVAIKVGESRRAEVCGLCHHDAAMKPQFLLKFPWDGGRSGVRKWMFKVVFKASTATVIVRGSDPL